MRYGDLSNKVAGRAYVVFEGCVAYLPEENTEEWLKLTSHKKTDWHKVMRLWEINVPVAHKINYLAWTQDINFTIVSWLPQDAVYGIDLIMSEFGVFAGIEMSTPEKMAKELVNRPDVTCIYDPVPEHVLTFGSKGYVIQGPADLGRII
jgi:hypothetical protein